VDTVRLSRCTGVAAIASAFDEANGIDARSENYGSVETGE
jgi:hypothetical protein